MTRRAASVIAALFLFAGCSSLPSSAPEVPKGPDPDHPLPAGAPRVLVLNTLSETISSLDLETGALSIQAATAGTWANRLVDVPARGEILCVASGDNELQLLARATLAPRAVIDVGAACNPWSAATWGFRRAIVTNWLEGTIVEIDLAANASGRRLEMSANGPEGVLVEGDVAYVACTNYHGPTGTYLEGRVDVVDLGLWSIVASIPVPRNPQEVLCGADGRLHVVCTGTYGTGLNPETGSVAIVDPGTRSVAGTVALGGAPGRAVFASNEVAWVAGIEGGVRRYNTQTLAVLPPFAEADLAVPGYSAIAWDPVGKTVYVTNFDFDLLVAIDEESATIRAVWLVGDGPIDVIVAR